MSFLSSQPRSMSELLTASFDLYAECFTKVIGYSLLAFVVNQLLSYFMMQSMPATFDPSATPEDQIAAMTQALPIFLVMLVIAALLSCVLYGATLYRIDAVAKGQEDDFTDVILLAAKKLPSMFLTGFLYLLVVTVGMFLLLIPGLILAVSLMFCQFFVLLEEQGSIDALMASHRLVWGDWWRTNWVIFVPIFLVVIVFAMVGAVLAFIFDPNSEAFNIVSGLLGAVISPYFYGIVYLQYRDLKLRKAM